MFGYRRISDLMRSIDILLGESFFFICLPLLCLSSLEELEVYGIGWGDR